VKVPRNHSGYVKGCRTQSSTQTLGEDRLDVGEDLERALASRAERREVHAELVATK
jgi:hypothetical protein